MQLPPLRPIKASPPGFAEVPIEADEEDQEPNFDVPQSREEKPAAYPHGPICIYESGVYLYFEPTAEQASTYDVIINVASEVKNPFTNPLPASKKDLDARRVDGPPAENVDFAAIPDRDNASSINTEGSSPTTPKAIAALDTAQPTEHMVNGTSYKSPEYIHMLWEHNTDIVPDLYKLVKMMDERVQQGKRILIHCQCGVSRSASLIVAYGIYKNPGISVQEAYDAVKKRSKWIGPNMNLIMQLQEFRNGLLRANESRGHPSAFGFPRRSAGLPTGVSNGTHRPSPFEREPASGSRTPRTAPLPPESDMGLQRASTGNIMSVSPGPLSAPSGSLFSPGFRQSWAASQTHFDLSPKTSPTTTAMPLVDPKNFVVPVLSMPDNVGPAQKVENAPTGQVAEPLLPVDLKPLPVPNFSRQLPFRQQAETENTALSQLIAPTQSAGLDTLVSPMVSSFDIPRIPTIQTRAPQFPSAKRFDSTAWPSGYESDSQPSPRSSGPNLNELPRSPRSSEFHKTGLEHETTNDVFGLLAPRAPNLTLKQLSGSGDEVSSDFEVSSPTITEFPRERFTRTDNVLDNRMTSLRATEFHMTPLKPRVPDEDPFGLASPRKFDFPSEPFEKAELTLPRDDEAETRRPSFQAILPPASLAQPEAINGFASLNGTTQALPNTHVQTPLSTVVPPTLINPTNLGDSFSNLIERKLPLSQPPRSSAVSPEGTESNVSKTPNHLLSSTSAKETKIRTRFSSPNLREQRKLHKLQTELEAMLPHKTLPPPQAVDDLDALMSPRAEEFTRNPFHFTLKSPVDDVSPASSNETITNAQPGVDWEDTQHFTPQKVAEDPRSPVLAGSSPIVRSIWDVL
jgi:tyrosine-protein phosphatase